MPHSAKKKPDISKIEPPATVKDERPVALKNGKVAVFNTNIVEATGTNSPDLQQRLVSQVFDTLWVPKGVSDEEKIVRVEAMMALLRGIKPADEIEGMLAAQMVSTHNAAMECLRRTIIEGQTIEGREQSLKHATKLLSTYLRQVEVLNKHRGKGHEKMTVGQVNVGSGGQAMVGHIETGSKSESPRNDCDPKPSASPKSRRR